MDVDLQGVQPLPVPAGRDDGGVRLLAGALDGPLAEAAAERAPEPRVRGAHLVVGGVDDVDLHAEGTPLPLRLQHALGQRDGAQVGAGAALEHPAGGGAPGPFVCERDLGAGQGAHHRQVLDGPAGPGGRGPDVAHPAAALGEPPVHQRREDEQGGAGDDVVGHVLVEDVHEPDGQGDADGDDPVRVADRPGDRVLQPAPGTLWRTARHVHPPPTVASIVGARTRRQPCVNQPSAAGRSAEVAVPVAGDVPPCPTGPRSCSTVSRTPHVPWR